MNDENAQRCGHNYRPEDCPHEPCGFKDALRLLRDTVSCLAPGQAVEMRGGGEGVIVAAMIEGNLTVSYRVAYWDGARLTMEWLAACLVEELPGEPAGCVRIGFKGTGQSSK